MTPEIKWFFKFKDGSKAASRPTSDPLHDVIKEICIKTKHPESDIVKILQRYK